MISLCQDAQYPYQNYQYQTYPQKNNFYYNSYRPYYNTRPNDYYKTKNIAYPGTSLAYRSGFSDFTDVASGAVEKVSHIGNEVRSRLKQVENVASNIKKLSNDLTMVTHGVDGNTNIAQRGLFDSGFADVISVIADDFKELKESVWELLSSIGNDINNIFKWLFNFPGFGIWNLITHFLDSFLRVIQFFPRALAHTFLPKSMESYLRSSRGNDYVPPSDSINMPIVPN